MKELGFNKFDRNAMLYYFLDKSDDWKNYNITRQQALNDEIRPAAMKNFRNKDFGNCLADDDYAVMKAMGLPVNTADDWNQIGETSQKKEQLFTPLKSIERQLLAVLKNTNVTEMERQLYPLLATAKSGDGTVLLQNHLGDFGLESLLNPSAMPAKSAAAVAPGAAAATAQPAVLVTETTPSGSAPPVNQAPSAPSTTPVAEILPVAAAAPAKETAPALPALAAIPGEGIIISAHQLAQVFAGLSIGELSCSRPIPEQQGMQTANTGILLFAVQTENPRTKGGAMEFDFAAGKITRIAFQLPTFRDFEQDVLDRPEVGGCRIEPSLLSKLH
jgi:hypothetical protein